MEAFLDPYTLRARVYPGLLVLAPLLVTGAALFGEGLTRVSAILSLLVSTGTLYLLSHLVREAGKSKERMLWRRWGGKPTTVKLRWRTAEPAGPRDLIRSRLSRLVPDVRLPTPEEESANPADADLRYDAAVSALREATRDKDRFPIVFAENVSYGFRRNTWAVRPLGVLTASTALVAGGHYLASQAPTILTVSPMLWAALTVDALIIVFWMFVVSEAWVRRAAEAYVEALFSATAALCSE